MSTYAKLINGKVQVAPKKTVRNKIVYSGSAYTDAMKIEDSYKLLIHNDMPTEEPNIGYHWESGWVESANAITQTWSQVANEPSLDEKVEEFLKKNLKPIDAFNVSGENGTRYYTLIFNNNNPQIETGDGQLNEELKHSIKKVPITDSVSGQTVNYYIPLLSEEALTRMGVKTN